MSRVGKKPIQIPEGVTVEILENHVVVKGKKGELSCDYDPQIKISQEKQQILLANQSEKKELKAYIFE